MHWGCYRSIDSWQSRSLITCLLGSGMNTLAETQKGFMETPEKHCLLTFPISQTHQVWIGLNFFSDQFKLLLKHCDIKSFASLLLLSTIDLVSVTGSRIGSTQKTKFDKLISYIFIFLSYGPYSRKDPAQNYFKGQ